MLHNKGNTILIMARTLVAMPLVSLIKVFLILWHYIVFFKYLKLII